MEQFVLPKEKLDDDDDEVCLNFTFQLMLTAMMPKFEVFCEQLIKLPLDERVSFAFDFFESIDGFPKVESKSTKSSDEALKFKELGNDAFKQEDRVTEALKFYTKSIATAPAGSQELAFAYGNRSAALLVLKRYEACIVDINRALQENYPEASRSKLYNRKRDCQAKIKKHAGCDDFDQKLQKLSLEEIDDALDLDNSDKFPLPQTELRNSRITNASEKIKINVDSTFGRHIVAVEDIEIGEFIGVEKAYASVLRETYQYSHCANCLLRCEALIPCPGCSVVMYCGRRCREDDFNRSHRTECQIHSFSNSIGLPLTTTLRLVIRILMIVTKQGENVETLMKDPLFKNPMKHIPRQVPKKFDSQDSVHLLSLENCTSLLADDPSSSIAAAWRIYRVLMIGYILRQTTYFDMVKKARRKNRNKSVKATAAEKEKYIGLLFMKLWISTPLYTFGVNELVQRKIDFISKHTDGINSVAKGFYLFHSLFNHSCFVNTGRSFYRDTLVTQAIQPIKAGEQIFTLYIPNFMAVPRYLRHEHLRSYQFECRCVACEKYWPLLRDMQINFMSMSNYSEATVQQVLRYRKEVSKFANNRSRVIEFSTDSFELFCTYLNYYHKHFDLPNEGYSYAYLIFSLLLQSRGNNYLHTRDRLLMSL